MPLLIDDRVVYKVEIVNGKNTHKTYNVDAIAAMFVFCKDEGSLMRCEWLGGSHNERER